MSSNIVKVMAYVVIPTIVLASVIGLVVYQSHIGSGAAGTSSGATIITSTMVHLGTIGGSSGPSPTQSSTVSMNSSATIVHTPPGVANESSTRTSTQQCANFSTTYSALASLETVNPNANSSYVGSVTVEILWSGSSPPIAGSGNSAQWNGTIRDSGTTEVVSGICDASYMIDRPSSSSISPWQISWSISKLTKQGTLQVTVSLGNNQTVVFNRSTSTPYGSVSGSLTISSGTNSTNSSNSTSSSNNVG